MSTCNLASSWGAVFSPVEIYSKPMLWGEVNGSWKVIKSLSSFPAFFKVSQSDLAGLTALATSANKSGGPSAVDVIYSLTSLGTVSQLSNVQVSLDISGDIESVVPNGLTYSSPPQALPYVPVQVTNNSSATYTAYSFPSLTNSCLWKQYATASTVAPGATTNFTTGRQYILILDDTDIKFLRAGAACGIAPGPCDPNEFPGMYYDFAANPLESGEQLNVTINSDGTLDFTPSPASPTPWYRNVWLWLIVGVVILLLVL